MTSELNVARAERWASAISGAAMAAYGLKRLKEERSAAGAVLTAAGSALIYRSATGFCPVYAAAGINMAYDRDDTREALAGSAGVHVVEAVTINRPAIELCSYWRRLVDLPASWTTWSRSASSTRADRTGWPKLLPAEPSNGTPRFSTKFRLN